MSLTLTNWVILCVAFGIGLIITWAANAEELWYRNKAQKLLHIAVGVGISFGVCLAIAAICSWYNTNTANGIRLYKDHQSNLSNGIEREITIMAEDGRQIFYYEGKVDVEANHQDNYIKFEGEDGKRYIIYYGIQDTITIIEKEN